MDRVDRTDGVSSLTVALPAPSGTMPLSLSAGASNVLLRVAGSVPARLTRADGTGSVTVYGQRRTVLPVAPSSSHLPGRPLTTVPT